MSETSHRTTILIAALAMLLVAVIVRSRIQQPSGTLPGTGNDLTTASNPLDNPDAQRPRRARPIDLVHLQQTRKEGSRFDCTVIGRLEGTMTQVAKVDVVIPILQDPIRSKWIAPWMLQYTTEIVRNDGNVLLENRQFEKLRRVELMAPATVTRLEYDFDHDVQEAISSVASTLLHAGAEGWSGMVLVPSKALGSAGISRLTGIDEAVLQKQKAMLTGTANILDDVEGARVELQLGNGHAEWHGASDLPAKVARVLGRVHSLIDYTALPDPDLAVGQEAVLDRLDANTLFPPDLVSPWFGNFDTDLTLTLTRREDRTMQGRTYAVFEGHGRLDLVKPDGKVYATFDVHSASLLVDHTEPDNRFLHELQIATPIETTVLSAQTGYKDVQWDGDLNLRLLYRVDVQP